MPDPTQTELSWRESSGSHPGKWLVRLPEAVRVDRLAELNAALAAGRRSARGQRVWWAMIRFAAMFCIGVAVTLAWPYGDAARVMMAIASPQSDQLAPPGRAGLIPDPAAAPHTAPADLDTVRERIDRLVSSQEEMTRAIAQLTASQAQIAEQIAKVQEVEQYLLYKVSYKGDDAPSHPPPAHRPSRPPPSAH